MGISKQLFNIILIILALLLLYFGYTFLTKPSAGPVGDDGSPELASSGFSSDEAGQTVSDEFLDTLTGLQGLDLRGEIFGNIVFKDLRDSNTLLPDGTPGRPNPFSPVNFSTLRFSNVNAVSTGSSTPASSTPAGTQSALDRLRAR